MIFPGSVSNCLLAVRGSMQPIHNRTTTIDEMSAAFGRKRQKPSKLGACERSKGNSREIEDLDGMLEIPSAITFDFVSMQLKR